MPRYIDIEPLIKNRVGNDPVKIAVECEPILNLKEEMRCQITYTGRCSVCNEYIMQQHKHYCGNCGARVINDLVEAEMGGALNE